jgi:hypothetical protein
MVVERRGAVNSSTALTKSHYHHPPMTPYRAATPDRLYVCPRCSAPDRAPLQGGEVTCSRCHSPHTLPDRTALPANPGALDMPPDDPARIQQLRAQDGRPRQVPATLLAVLGAPSILPGREQESVAIWQSLRTRSAQGDVTASEDLSMLTLLMVQSPVAKDSPDLADALSESAFDAAVLPRHKQEQLGVLLRAAVARGDRTGAQRYLSWMTPGAPDLETDSELRVSAAMLATLDRDGRRVLALLGPRKSAIPIDDSLDDLASVLRANAFELLGDRERAADTLRELQSSQDLARVSARYAALQLCAQAGQAYTASTTEESVKRVAANVNSTSFAGGGLGIVFAVLGLGCLGVGVAMTQSDSPFEAIISFATGALFTVGGTMGFVHARKKAKRAVWLRRNGLSLTARILGADKTGMEVGDTPVYSFVVEVAGPEGSYQASFSKLVPEHKVPVMLGTEVRVYADPDNLREIIVDE